MAQQAKQVPLMWTVVICLTIGLRGYVALPNDVPDIFYEFGTSEGDLIAPVNDDGSTLVDVSAQFPFFDSAVNDSLYVNTNGLLSFHGPVSQYTPNPFPLGYDRRVVAPFWADVDTRINNGRIYYRETTDGVTLESASHDVRDAFADMYQFSATWVFVSTWYGVTYYGGSTTTPVNSFQAVLITDGRHSFIIFNYGNITWTSGTASSGDSSTGLGGTPAHAGYDAGDGIHYFSINGSLEAGIVDVETTSNVDRTGRWVFRIDTAEILPHCCPKWTGPDCKEIARYNCQDNNPCTDDNINNPLCDAIYDHVPVPPNMYFAHDNPSQYIQCHPGPNLCYVMPCPGGLVWDPHTDNCNYPLRV